jgi:hypothetical protein
MIHLLTQSTLDAEALQIIKDNLMNCAKAADLHAHSVKERARKEAISHEITYCHRCDTPLNADEAVWLNHNSRTGLYEFLGCADCASPEALERQFPKEKLARYRIHWEEKLVFDRVVEASDEAEARTIALEEVYGVGAENVVHIERGFRDALFVDTVFNEATHAVLSDFEVTKIIYPPGTVIGRVSY